MRIELDMKEPVLPLCCGSADVNQIARGANNMHRLYAGDAADLKRHGGVLPIG